MRVGVGGRVGARVRVRVTCARHSCEKLKRVRSDDLQMHSSSHEVSVAAESSTLTATVTSCSCLGFGSGLGVRVRVQVRV